MREPSLIASLHLDQNSWYFRVNERFRSLESTVSLPSVQLKPVSLFCYVEGYAAFLIQAIHNFLIITPQIPPNGSLPDKIFTIGTRDFTIDYVSQAHS